jgi:hypothetical protein
MPDVKAISLWQPWATLIALGEKEFETRSWGTHYRGPLAIHASKKVVSDVLGTKYFQMVLGRAGYHGKNLPTGTIVAIANLVAVLEMTPDLIRQQSDQELAFGDWRPGRMAWKLENVRPLDAYLPATGRQGLFTVYGVPPSLL